MKQDYFIFMFILLLVSCQNRLEKSSSTEQSDKAQHNEIVIPYESFFKVDTLLEDRYHKVSKFTLYPSDTILELHGACRCEKNMVNNSIKIQVWTFIPTKTELDTLKDPEFVSMKFLDWISLKREFGQAQPFQGQLKLVNIELQDSLVKSINMMSKSTGKEYSGREFKKESVDKYKIKASRNYYSNASKVFGEFELVLPKGYGISENDTILRGTFSCWNGTVYDESTVRNWNLNR
jgi:hypothetical protein